MTCSYKYYLECIQTKRGYSERWGYSEGSNTFKNPQAYELYFKIIIYSYYYNYSEVSSEVSVVSEIIIGIIAVRNSSALPYNSIHS